MQFPKLGSGKDILIQNCQEILNGHRKAVSTLSKAKCSLAIVPWSSDNGGIFSKHQATHWSVKKIIMTKKLFVYIFHFIIEKNLLKYKITQKLLFRLQ